MSIDIGVIVEADFSRVGTYDDDLTADVNVAGGKPISIRRGINAKGIYTVSRVAFGLNNLDGKYAPLNTGSVFAGEMTQGVPIRIKLNTGGGGYTVIWTGRIQQFRATTQARRRRVAVSCNDIAVYLQQYDTLNVLASSVRDTDGALVAIMDALGIGSGDYSFDDGVQDLAYHFVRDGNAMRAVTDVVKSEAGGLFFILKDGRYKFQGRDQRLGSTPDDTWGDGTNIKPYWMEVDNNDDDLIATAEVRANIYQPGEAENLVFTFSRNFRHQPTADSLEIAAGATYGPVLLNYLSPAETLIEPVANEHYGINSAQDASGADKSSTCPLIVVHKGAGFELTIGPNTDAGKVYATWFDLYATPTGFVADKPVFIAGKSIIGDFADRSAAFDLPFTDDSGQTAQDYSVQLMRTFRQNFTKLNLAFDLERHADHFAALTGLEIGDLIKYKDTALTNKGAYVDGLFYVEGIDWGVPFGGKGKVKVNVKLYESLIYRNLAKIIYDNFTRADGALGTTTSNDVWADTTGVTIVSNKAEVSGAIRLPNIDLSSADCVIEADLSGLTSGQAVMGLIARHVDASNYWTVNINAIGGTDIVVLQKVVASSGDSLATVGITVTDLHELRWVIEGDRHRVWVDNVLLIDEVDSFNNTATKVGLYGVRVDGGPYTWDDFYASGL